VSVSLPRVIVTNCTTRKVVGAPVALQRVRNRDDLQTIAREWKSLLKRFDRRFTAAELYKGRSMVDAAAAAKLINGTLHVVSAGLGVVASEDKVPNYDVTVSPGSALSDALKARALESTDWWSAIAEPGQHTLSTLVDGAAAYVALPSTYLRMVRRDLSNVSKTAQRRLRIFTSVAGRREVPEALSTCVVPYDERLETVVGFEGTRADFPQRALRHFVEVLRGHELSLRDGREAVHSFLSYQRVRVLPKRRRVSDDEVRQLLRKHWGECMGSGTRLLRFLRDEALVSCEQGRFRTLWLEVAATRST
jgi:hypothetical protein